MLQTVLLCIGFLASLYGTVMGLIASGLFLFSYFTTLSNVMVTIACFWLLFKKIRTGRGTQGVFFRHYFFVTIVSITITFLVYLFILAPTFDGGFFAAYRDNHFASLAAHFITPLCSILYYMRDTEPTVSKKSIVPASIVFPLCYVFFAFVLGKLGLRWDGMPMPYNFINYDAPCGWFGFKPDTISATTLGIGAAYMILVLLLLFILIGFLLFLIRKKLDARRQVHV